MPEANNPDTELWILIGIIAVPSLSDGRQSKGIRTLLIPFDCRKAIKES